MRMRLDISCRLFLCVYHLAIFAPTIFADHLPAFRDLLQTKFEKVYYRQSVLQQEMLAIARGTAERPLGNEGLRRTASLLFNPLINFSTVRLSALAVSQSIVIAFDLDGFTPGQGLNNRDTVRLFQNHPTVQFTDFGPNEPDHPLLF